MLRGARITQALGRVLASDRAAETDVPAFDRAIPANTTSMVKKPEPPLLSTFDVFRIAHKAILLGTVEARDAIERVARERRRLG